LNYNYSVRSVVRNVLEASESCNIEGCYILCMLCELGL
jgi:hypothetical protein